MRNKSVCFPPDCLSLSLLLWQLCLFHRPHYESLCLSSFPPPRPLFPLFIPETEPDLWLPQLLLCRSIFRPDCQVITSQVTAAYSESWEVIRVGLFWFCSFAEVLRAGFSMWISAGWFLLPLCVGHCLWCSHPHPLGHLWSCDRKAGGE